MKIGKKLTARENGIWRRRAPVVLLSLLLAALTWGGTVWAGGLTSSFSRELPTSDPLSPLWSKAPASTFPLSPQQVTTPELDRLTVPAIQVQSLHNDTWIVFRLVWADPTRDTGVGIGSFTDAAAIQLPLQDEIPFSPFMGSKGVGRVQILHWKARWQDDLDRGYRDVENIYPNMYYDFYPMAEGGRPYPLKKAFGNPDAAGYMAGMRVGNPMAQPDRLSPVEEGMAEGFGTMTTQPHQDSTGKGVWKEGKWFLVVARPLVTNDPNDKQITKGQKTSIAFAVWDGSHQQRGARKQITKQWIDFMVGP